MDKWRWGLKGQAEAGAFVNGALGVNLVWIGRATDEVMGDLGRAEGDGKAKVGILPRADHDIVNRQDLVSAVTVNMQALGIKVPISNTPPNLHAFGGQMGAVDPARGFAQSLAGIFGFALQEPHLPVSRGGGGLCQAARCDCRIA